MYDYFWGTILWTKIQWRLGGEWGYKWCRFLGITCTARKTNASVMDLSSSKIKSLHVGVGELPDSPGKIASPDNISGKRHPTAQMSTLDS